MRQLSLLLLAAPALAVLAACGEEEYNNNDVHAREARIAPGDTAAADTTSFNISPLLPDTAWDVFFSTTF